MSVIAHRVRGAWDRVRSVRQRGFVVRLGTTVMLAWLVATLWPASGHAESITQTAQAEAVAAIPLQQMTPEAQAKLLSVVNRPSLYRQMPTTLIESDADLYQFLVRHPEVIVNMWDLLGITKVSITRTKDFQFEATDGAGTVTRIELVYGDQNVHVVYCEGAYEGPLFKRLLTGRCVLLLRSSYTQTMDQTTYVSSRLDVFLQIDNAGTELIAKTLQPVVGGTADRNFTDSLKFLGQVAKAVEEKPDRVQALSQRLTKVSPRVRDDFASLSALVAQRYVTRKTGLQPVSRIQPLDPGTVPAQPASATFSLGDGESPVQPLTIPQR